MIIFFLSLIINSIILIVIYYILVVLSKERVSVRNDTDNTEITDKFIDKFILTIDFLIIHQYYLLLFFFKILNILIINLTSYNTIIF